MSEPPAGVSGPPSGQGLLHGIRAPLVHRSAWRARPPVDWEVEQAPVRAVVLHHTATSNDDPDPLAMVRRVQQFHAEARGWGDIGYSFLVLEDGRVVEGRADSLASAAPLGVIAGHAYGHNVGTLGVAVAGRFHHCGPTPAAWATTVSILAAICRSCDLDPTGGPVVLANGRSLPAVISAHRHAVDTSCPGDELVARLPQLRAEVARCPEGPDRG